jgi:hypothetical protein
VTVQLPTAWLDALYEAAGRPRYLEAIAGNPKQLAFVKDDADRKTALCGRRGGKTTGIAGWLYGGMVERPGTRQVYIGITRGSARQILWDGVLLRMVKEYGLPLRETMRDGQLIIRHSNGSTLWIAGCDDKRELDKFRGQPFYRVNIDEAQGFPEEVLQPLIEDVLEPALADYRGQIALTGTPGPLDIGYFHAATTGMVGGWSCGHQWDVRDNPWFANDTQTKDTRYPNRAAEFLADGLLKCNNDPEHPTYLREYLGKWVHDAGALVYPFTGDNSWQPESAEHPFGLPHGDYVYGLGVDLGFGERSTAFVLAAYRRGTGEVYLLKAYTRSRLIPTHLAAHVQAVRERLRKEVDAGLRVVVDEGALGKGYAEQMRSMGVGCEAAEKSEKRSYQEYVGGLIRGKQVKCNFAECKDLLVEAKKLQFDPETAEEDERYTRHCCDAMLYIVRSLFPRYNPELVEPVYGSPEWHRAQAKAIRDEHIKAAKKRQAAR